MLLWAYTLELVRHLPTQPGKQLLLVLLSDVTLGMEGAEGAAAKQGPDRCVRP